MTSKTLTCYTTADTATLLTRIAAQEARSESSTIAMLIRKEAAQRGLVGRAPGEEPVPEKVSATLPHRR